MNITLSHSMPTKINLTQRVRLLRSRLRHHDADGLLVTHAPDIRYLTGFTGHDSWAYIPLDRGRVYLISDFRYVEQIQRDAPHAVAIIRKKSISQTLAKLIAPDRRNADRILLQRDHVTLSQRRVLAKAIGTRRLRDIDDGILEQRAVKDEHEIRLILRSIRLAERAFVETRGFISSRKSGVTEVEVCAFLEYRMRALGAEGVSFDSVVAVDANAALPHAIPSSKKITHHSLIQFDWGARFGGYCSDLSRVVTLGKVKPKLREIYRIVLDAQQAAIDVVAPGVRYKDIDAAGRKVIAKAGYAKQFGHGTGHGIGLDIHELPVVGGQCDKEAVAGEIVTIEPGIYLPGVGGVRIEDDVLVTRRGGRVLSDLPKSFESTMI